MPLKACLVKAQPSQNMCRLDALTPTSRRAETAVAYTTNRLHEAVRKCRHKA